MKLRIIESNSEQSVDMIFSKFTADELRSVGIWSKGDVKKLNAERIQKAIDMKADQLNVWSLDRDSIDKLEKEIEILKQILNILF
jgi:hypothetical protein